MVPLGTNLLRKIVLLIINDKLLVSSNFVPFSKRMMDCLLMDLSYFGDITRFLNAFYGFLLVLLNR